MNETKQFGSFDGLDNRKEVMRMFKRLGEGCSEDEACARRAVFLQSLLADSRSSLAGRPCNVQPCTPTEAYFQFVALTGVLGVPIEKAAKRLEEAVK